MPIERPAAIAWLVAGAFFMENLDATVIVTAIPQMAASFGVDPVDLSLGVSAYILALAILIPASGWLADRFGARSVFTSAILIFTIASVVCGFSQDFYSFIGARILQGIGGAMMVPVGRLIVVRSAGKANLISAISTIVWPGLAAPVLGPPLGGFITTYASWHWIFFLNVPLGIAAMAFSLRLIPATTATQAREFDWTGFALTGFSCFAIMLGLQLLSNGTTPWPIDLAYLAIGLVAGLLAIRHARLEPKALVDLWALRLKTFAVTIRGGSFFRAAIGAVPFLLPLLFQIGFGLDAFQSGLLVLSVFAGNIIMKIFTTRILNRFGFRNVLLVNGTLNAIILFACAFIAPETPVPVICAVLFASGLTRSMQFTTLATLAYADVPDTRMSGANTLLNIAQPLGMALGIALAALALRAGALILPGPSSTLTLGQFHLAFVFVAVVAAIGILDCIGLSRDAGLALRKLKSGPPSRPSQLARK